MKKYGKRGYGLFSEHFVCNACLHSWEQIYEYKDEDITCPKCGEKYSTESCYISTETGWIVTIKEQK